MNKRKFWAEILPEAQVVLRNLIFVAHIKDRNMFAVTSFPGLHVKTINVYLLLNDFCNFKIRKELVIEKPN